MTVGDLFVAVLQRLPGKSPQSMDFISAAQLAVDLITDELWSQRSDQLEDDLVQVVNAGESSFDLPAVYLGFKTFPWLSTYKTTLTPIPEGKKKIYDSEGIPEHFELRGFTVNLYPTPVEEVTLNWEIYQKPDALVDLSSVIPFSGVYDQVITEMVLAVGKNGMAIAETQGFKLFAADKIAAVRHRRPKKLIVWRYPA